MATAIPDAAIADEADREEREERGDSAARSRARSRKAARGPFGRTLHALSSLRLTVWLFAASIFIVFAGTLAQTRLDIWDVIDQYFRFRPGTLFSRSFPFVNLGELFVWIDAGLFFPPAFAPSRPEFPNWLGIWFPKGWTIGVVMLANLLAAHQVRYKLQAKGTRLLAGLVVTALGVLLTTGVIVTSGGLSGLQQSDPAIYGTIWKTLLLSMLLLGAGGVYAAFLLPKSKGLERVALGGFGVFVGTIAAWLGFEGNEAQFSDASMRILWDLVKATVAGLVLLAGCVLLFRKRAGIVLLHAGVMLLMVGEIVVGLVAVESRMTILEGRSANFSQDIRSYELVLSKIEADGTQTEAIVDADRLREIAGTGNAIVDAALPVSVRVERWVPNALVRKKTRGNEATIGVGEAAMLEAAATSTGVEASAVDAPGAIVRLTTPGADTVGSPEEASGFDETMLLSVLLGPQRIEIRGEMYDVALRFERHYKPYTITLRDFTERNYIGTDTPQDYRSTIAFADPSRGFSKESHEIWMNNPLRYAGETFYQSSLTRGADGVPNGTVLQIVSNAGWSIPYVACMVTAVGLLAQFFGSLLRYINRRREGRLPEQRAEPVQEDDDVDAIVPSTLDASRESRQRATWAAIAALLVSLLMVGRYASPKTVTDPYGRDITAFGSLPVVEGGRVKPMSSLAINTALQLGDKQLIQVPVVDPDGEPLDDGTPPMTLQKVAPEAFLLDVVSQREVGGDAFAYRPSEEAREELGLPADRLYTKDEIAKAAFEGGFLQGELAERESLTPTEREILRLLDPVLASDAARVFRIESIDVLQTLNLTRRKGTVYSFAEILPSLSKLNADFEAARKRDAEDRTLYQRKVIETAQKVFAYLQLRLAFAEPDLPRLPSSTDMAGNERLRALVGRLLRTEELPRLNTLSQLQTAPRVLPNELPSGSELADVYQTRGERDAWLRYGDAAAINAYLTSQEKLPMDATIAFANVRRAAADASVAEGDLNARIEAYRDQLLSAKAADYSPAKLAFETHYNHFAPFWVAGYLLYLPAFLAVVASWVGKPRQCLAVAFTLVCVAFVVHTYALGARYYISGRPPVTNLYTAAVFVGWAAAVFGIALELIFRGGLGSLIAAIGGFSTMTIGNALAQDGDTFTVMQAVLDTQFWLSTHVVTITLGYAATLVAALVGMIYILRGVLTSSLDFKSAKLLTRVCYGVNCFAILFSFVGTVLGGLWADDSWGRFWGWDPKENGALMIVLWNALVLHANWGKMVGERGLAVLSVLGGIVVSWSWFGVNELGVGLHSYGFTEGVLRNLGVFCLSLLAVAGVGMLPRSKWRSVPATAGVARPTAATPPGDETNNSEPA